MYTRKFVTFYLPVVSKWFVSDKMRNVFMECFIQNKDIELFIDGMINNQKESDSFAFRINIFEKI